MMISKRFQVCNAGASVVEYALMLALVALVTVMVLRHLSGDMARTIGSAGNQMTSQNIPGSAPAAPEH
jgi:Flp pilus assembly pilin Flp